MNIIELWTICSANGIVLGDDQMEMLNRYITELIYWNSKVNLISRKDEQNIIEKHILHSLSVLKYVGIPVKSRCLDVGTGGGLPGLPVAIACRGIQMLLLDSIKKKIKLTEMFARHTGLRNVDAICSRVETLQDSKNYFQYFDFIFSRGVGKAVEVLSWVTPILKPGGKVILYKGGDLEAEIDEAKKKFKSINIENIQISLFGCGSFAGDDKRLLMCTA